ncbi:MAG: hypothetical protein RSG96_07975, partial [Clostridia bacterium]
LNECALRNACGHEAACLRGYAPKGKTPIVYTEAKRMKMAMLSAVSQSGKPRFILYRDNVCAEFKKEVTKSWSIMCVLT